MRGEAQVVDGRLFPLAAHFLFDHHLRHLPARFRDSRRTRAGEVLIRRRDVGNLLHAAARSLPTVVIGVRRRMGGELSALHAAVDFAADAAHVRAESRKHLIFRRTGPITVVVGRAAAAETDGRLVFRAIS